MRVDGSQKSGSDPDTAPPVRFICACSGLEDSHAAEAALHRAGAKFIQDFAGLLSYMEFRVFRHGDDEVECVLEVRLANGRSVRVREAAMAAEPCIHRSLKLLKAKLAGETRRSSAWSRFGRSTNEEAPASVPASALGLG